MKITGHPSHGYILILVGLVDLGGGPKGSGGMEQLGAHGSILGTRLPSLVLISAEPDPPVPPNRRGSLLVLSHLAVIESWLPCYRRTSLLRWVSAGLVLRASARNLTRFPASSRQQRHATDRI